MLRHAPTCAPPPARPLIRKGQIWQARDSRRRGTYRILWVSDCGQFARIMRVGGPEGWNITAERLHRHYRPVRRSA